MPPTDQLDVIVPPLADLVEQLTPTDLHRSTPCDRFDVHDVPNHMLTLADSFAYLFRGEQPPEPMPLTDDGWVPATVRDGDTFKAPTTPPSAATPIERLAAFSGRTV